MKVSIFDVVIIAERSNYAYLSIVKNRSMNFGVLVIKMSLTLFRLGGGLFEPPPPSGKIVITPTPKELWRSNFLTFPKIYLGTFWYNYHVHVINHVAMATSFWHIGFGKFKKWWFFLVLRSRFYTYSAFCC